jgi:diguanylate cyclase (GGDEF)-like protein/PAS domain S-box-containing protein
MSLLVPLITPFLAIASFAYAALAVSVSSTGDQYANRTVSIFLFLIAGMLAGSAFSYGAIDATVYGIGRTLSFFCAGFIPVAFYVIYREYTVGAPSALTIAILSVVPLLTTGLALSNSMHNMIWVVTETATGLSHSLVSDHYWYNRIYAPFTYGLFGYSAIALIGHLPTIAPAHRRTILLLLLCALLPYAISIANNFFGVGARDFPLTSTTLALVWPLFAYASLKVRMHEFSPIAYQTLFDHVRDPIFVVDNEQCIICANVAAQKLLEGKESDLIGRKLWEDFPVARRILQQARELDLTQTLRMDTNNIFEVSVGPLAGSKGQNTGMVVVCRDVTERRAALSQLADSEHLIRTLVETSSNGILRFTRDDTEVGRKFQCVFANRAAGTFLDEARGPLVGTSLGMLEQLKPDKLYEHFGGETRCTSALSFDVAAETGSNEKWMRIIGEPVGEDFSVTLIDITQHKRSEDQMLADALCDPLTGTLNRRGFEKEGASRLRQSSVGAVLYLDLNHFKSVNDQFGHQAGDALLRAFGNRLEFCLRPEDVLGRLGGDEFAIVLPGVSVDDAKYIAERLVRTASDAYIIQGQEIQCTASVGIALLPKHGDELWHLVSIADGAMYQAKNIPEEDAANDRAAYVDAATAS